MDIISILNSLGASQEIISKCKTNPELVAELTALYAKYEAKELEEKAIKDKAQKHLDENNKKKTSGRINTTNIETESKILDIDKVHSDYQNKKTPDVSSINNKSTLGTDKKTSVPKLFELPKNPNKNTSSKKTNKRNKGKKSNKRNTNKSSFIKKVETPTVEKETTQIATPVEKTVVNNNPTQMAKTTETPVVEQKPTQMATPVETPAVKKEATQMAKPIEPQNKIQGVTDKTTPTLTEFLAESEDDTIDYFKREPPKKPEIKPVENDVKGFFNDNFKNRILSFDTETTGLDVKSEDLGKRSRIWQIGLAEKEGKGLEYHTSPFYEMDVSTKKLTPYPKMNKADLVTNLRKSNGLFSETAFREGNFIGFVDDYLKGNLSTLDHALSETLGKIKASDVIVLQNMNFENTMLKSSLDQGLISPNVYTKIADRMETVSLSTNGQPLHLFERPLEVQRLMREADMIYHTEYLNNQSESSFSDYRERLNKSLDVYKTRMNDPNRNGALAVELQDITKTFFANAAEKGYLEKGSVTLGLNVDFLSRNILGRSEKHTALSDSVDTIELFDKILNMDSEIKKGSVSEGTKEILSRIKKDQPNELNKRFLSSVRSVINDFKIHKKTNIKDNYSWYNPESTLRTKVGGTEQVDKLIEVSTGKKGSEKNINVALDTVLDTYKNYQDDIGGFNRENYVNSIKESFNQNRNYSEIHKQVDADYYNFKSSEHQGSLLNSKPKTTGEGKSNTKFALLAGVGAGLAYMWLTPKPRENPYTDYNVSEQFYDDQYLGTAFVDFKERNKHYMM